ncbi:MAG: DUF4062 domain-containing protein [Pirellulales bacterium]|nr:DUF4062 domain-containing protein [Pirellulales bacterium]
MEKRYQVFVSSTFQDLKEERSEVIQALLEMDCIPSGMELFPASDETQWEIIKRVIDDCDYYVVVIGGRYGTTDSEGLSYTEREFDYAVSTGTPVLAFPIQDPSQIPAGKTEMEAEAQKKLAAFRDKVCKNRTVKFWSSIEDLGAKVSRAINHAIKHQPAEGWVKAGCAGDPETVLKLRARIDELETELNNVTTKPPVGIDDLAQGGEEFDIHFSAWEGYDQLYRKFNISWDRLIAILGPLMMNESTEEALKQTIKHFLEMKLTHEHLSNFLVDDESFQTIKIQLMALGIIQKSERKRTPSDKGTYWSLTPYGANYVMKLKAIQRT